MKKGKKWNCLYGLHAQTANPRRRPSLFWSWIIRKAVNKAQRITIIPSSLLQPIHITDKHKSEETRRFVPILLGTNALINSIVLPVFYNWLHLWAMSKMYFYVAYFCRFAEIALQERCSLAINNLGNNMWLHYILTSIP